MDKLKITITWAQDDVLNILIDDHPIWTCEGKCGARAVAALLTHLGSLGYIALCEYDSGAEYTEALRHMT